MKRSASIPLLLAATGLAGYLTTAGCGSTGKASGFAKDEDPLGEDGGNAIGFSGSNETGKGPCVGLECSQVQCAGGAKTTVSGTVYDPSGILPMYNTLVYVPNAQVKPLTEGINCDKCGAVASGNPIVTAITGPDGSFVIENVPVGVDVPLVIQIGKWRRQVKLPRVEKCVETKITDRELLRLPANRAEGDMPQMAFATGSIDPLQCLLRKIGINDSEFTLPTKPGRIHIYQENGMGISGNGERDAQASRLYGNAETLKKYDVVILPCGANDLNKTLPDKQRLIDYTAAGGRLFTTHYGYDWLRDAPAPFASTATYRTSDTNVTDPTAAQIDTSFPKGLDFAKWLVVAEKAVNPTSNPVEGRMAIREARLNVDAVVAPTRQWIRTEQPPSVQHFTFNTPVGAPAESQCGRVVYSNFHVVSGSSTIGDRFPMKCGDKTPLTQQELALVFMLFDLSSCIQSDTDRPKPPPVK